MSVGPGFAWLRDTKELFASLSVESVSASTPFRSRSDDCVEWSLSHEE
jgi:hypothetical protein